MSGAFSHLVGAFDGNLPESTWSRAKHKQIASKQNAARQAKKASPLLFVASTSAKALAARNARSPGESRPIPGGQVQVTTR
jgi:hypothetical protein